MFEITSIAAKDTFDVELLSPNDEPLKDADGVQLSVTVYGPGSIAYHRAAIFEYNRRALFPVAYIHLVANCNAIILDLGLG